MTREVIHKVSSAGIREPIKVRPTGVKAKRSVSRTRKLILLLLTPVEIACEIMVNRPWLSLFAIFGVIIFIGKFISAKVGAIMALSLLVLFLILNRFGGATVGTYGYDDGAMDLDDTNNHLSRPGCLIYGSIRDPSMGES